MSFLDDLLENDDTLAQTNVNDDPTVRELVSAAAREGNVGALRSAIERGQVGQNAPEDLVLEVVGIAGDKIRKPDAKEIAKRVAFVAEWVEATSPEDPAARQLRLDKLLAACVSSIFHVHDAVAAQLVELGANPLAYFAPPVVDSASTVVESTTEAAATVRHLAIIGTAGRDKDKPMTAQLWDKMLADARTRVHPSDVLVSGGAAWADHLAVALFLEGRVAGLKLHLPAPLKGKGFDGPQGSAASAANYYHEMFSKATGLRSLDQIHEAIARGGKFTEQPPAKGYGAMFARNKIVAEASEAVLAYTFGEGQEPADGGTKNTWDQIPGGREHVPLGALLAAPAAQAKAAEPTGQASVKVVVPAMNISGARLGLQLVESSILAQAIYAQSDATGAMTQAVAGQKGQGAGVPVVGTLRRFDIEIPVNAAAFAIAVADLRQLDRVLQGLSLQDPRVQDGLGEAIEQVLKLQLHEFGVDEVHHGIARLVAAGASGPVISALTKMQVTLTKEPSLKWRDAQGRIIDGEKTMDAKEIDRLRSVSMPLAFLHAKNSKTVIGALEVIRARGWNPNEPLGEQGATILHHAALRGDANIVNTLRAMGADITIRDKNDRTAVDYAFFGADRELAFKLDPKRARDLLNQEGAGATARQNQPDLAASPSPEPSSQSKSAFAPETQTAPSCVDEAPISIASSEAEVFAADRHEVVTASTSKGAARSVQDINLELTSMAQDFDFDDDYGDYDAFANSPTTNSPKTQLSATPDVSVAEHQSKAPASPPEVMSPVATPPATTNPVEVPKEANSTGTGRAASMFSALRNRQSQAKEIRQAPTAAFEAPGDQSPSLARGQEAAEVVRQSTSTKPRTMFRSAPR